MKITKVETGIVALPNDEPLGGFSENPNAKNPIVWLRLGTDDGVEGLGVTYFGGALTRTLRKAVDDMAALVIGEDPILIEAIAAKLRAAAVSAGPAGIFTMALSAIDVALWDIKGKALGLPLWKLLGGGREHIATYASGALRRGLRLEEALIAAQRLREKGHRQTKMQLGLPGITSPAREVEQARLIRRAVGPDMDLMCDINQRWRPEQAIDIGRQLEAVGVGLYWLEDVTAHDDYAGLARVSAALATPVAGGEYLYGIVPFRHMLEARSVDIVMIDQVRSGGITPWLKIAGMAEAFNLPVVSHGVPEIHVHLVGAVPNGLTVEYMPRLFHLWEGVPVPENGLLPMPTAPGLGLKFSQDAIRRFAVE
ncbi:MAG: mandelate racemase/muconate lactonizing enzyme family protein [Alphaproteobacteria bacterium]|nr:mandelate racemase/muconate lactonizing enzyme family protein [Alphaproteobacteria bacterium]